MQLVNKDADMDKIKLEVEASKLPPVVPTTVRRRKPPSVSVEEDEANVKKNFFLKLKAKKWANILYFCRKSK